MLPLSLKKKISLFSSEGDVKGNANKWTEEIYNNHTPVKEYVMQKWMWYVC